MDTVTALTDSSPAAAAVAFDPNAPSPVPVDLQPQTPSKTSQLAAQATDQYNQVQTIDQKIAAIATASGYTPEPLSADAQAIQDLYAQKAAATASYTQTQTQLLTSLAPSSTLTAAEKAAVASIKIT
jgi:hypothetical protein